MNENSNLLHRPRAEHVLADEDDALLVPPAENQVQPGTLTAAQNHPLESHSVKKYLEIHHNPDTNEYSKTIFTMSIGLSHDDVDRAKCDELIKKKAITRSDIKPTAKTLRAEIQRRYECISNNGESMVSPGKYKKTKPSPRNWDVPKMTKWLEENALLPEDALVVKQAIADFLSNVETEFLDDLEERNENGYNISKPNKRKMRLYEACFHDDFRGDLLDLGRSMPRVRLDERNSSNRPKTFFEKVADKYNDVSWIPKSTVVDVHPDLCGEIKLSPVLQKDKRYHTYTAEDVKKLYTDVKGQFNVAFAGWRASGNGKMLSSEAAGLKKVKFLGSHYKNNDGNDSDDTDDSFEYLKDDRLEFCKGELHVYYFWCLADVNRVVLEVSSNCNAVGLNVDEDMKETSKMESKPKKKKKKKSNNFDVGDALSQMESSMKSVVSDFMQFSGYDTQLDRLKSDQSELFHRLQTLKDSLTNIFEKLSNIKSTADRDEELYNHLSSRKTEIQEQIKRTQDDYNTIESQIKNIETSQSNGAIKKRSTESESDSESDSSDDEQPKKRSRRSFQPNSSDLASIMDSNNISRYTTPPDAIDLVNKDDSSDDDSSSDGSSMYK